MVKKIKYLHTFENLSETLFAEVHPPKLCPPKLCPPKLFAWNVVITQVISVFLVTIVHEIAKNLLIVRDRAKFMAMTGPVPR